MMEKADPAQKLYTRMRLWEFSDQYVIEPTDGSSGSCMAISRVDASMNLIGCLLLTDILCFGFSLLLFPSTNYAFYLVHVCFFR